MNSLSMDYQQNKKGTSAKIKPNSLTVLRRGAISNLPSILRSMELLTKLKVA